MSTRRYTFTTGEVLNPALKPDEMNQALARIFSELSDPKNGFQFFLDGNEVNSLEREHLQRSGVTLELRKDEVIAGTISTDKNTATLSFTNDNSTQEKLLQERLLGDINHVLEFEFRIRPEVVHGGRT